MLVLVRVLVECFGQLLLQPATLPSRMLWQLAIGPDMITITLRFVCRHVWNVVECDGWWRMRP